MKTTPEVETNTMKTTPPVAGNTKAATSGVTLIAKAFQLTIWKLDTYPAIKEYLTGLKLFRYFLAYKEVGELKEGEHIHIYVNYKNRVQISLKKTLSAHIEICRGSAEQNINYISKQGNKLDEIGVKPRPGERTDIKNVKEMTREQRDTLPLQMYNIVQKINQEESNKVYIDDMYKEVKVYYIWGETGVGKTCKAKEIIKEWFKNNRPGEKPFCNIVKCIDGYWHGIGAEKVACLYDDWRDSHMKPSEFIHFIDYNKQRLNVKGGGVSNEYQLIVITSVQDIKAIYKNMQDEEPRKQWERRMTVMHLEKLKDVDDTGDKNRIDL